MATEKEIATTFHESTRDFFRERIEYKRITALLVRWEESDLNGLVSELETVHELFEKDLGYLVENYQIPLKNSQQELNQHVAEFISSYSRNYDTLIILHYSGHGDEDEDGQAIWTA